MKKLLIFFTALLSMSISILAQQGLTLETALSIAEENSPSILRTRLNLIRSQENLNAQRASLKSNFSLSINPIEYTHNREFNDLVADYFTRETTTSYGAFTISQPIVATDARVSLINNLQWQDSYSEYSDSQTKGFTNNRKSIQN